MLDLETLGQELRRRRRALRIPSAEFARRIGVSPTYIWLIEQAKPRKSGEGSRPASRPSEELLTRWTAALGMDEADARRLREMAGYFDPDAVLDRAARDPHPDSPPRATPAARIRDEIANEREPMVSEQHLRALRRWSGAEQPDDDEQALLRRMHHLLRRADRRGRRDEALHLLSSYLRWLDSYIEDEP